MIAPEPIDWPLRWRRTVEARAAQVTRLRGAGAGHEYWNRRASGYGASHANLPDDDPVVVFLRGRTGSTGTVLDVGAGTGRYAIALAPHVASVTAIEPSAAMADILASSATAHGIDNIRIVRERWEDCTGEQADVVLCAHVLYPIADVVPFIAALQGAARRLCVLVLRAYGPTEVLQPAWRLIHGEDPQADPSFIEAYNLLWSMGIRANVEFVPRMAPWEFPDRDGAVAWARDMLWAGAEVGDDSIWAAIEPLLRVDSHSLVVKGGGPPIAIVSWSTEPGA